MQVTNKQVTPAIVLNAVLKVRFQRLSDPLIHINYFTSSIFSIPTCTTTYQ